MSEAKAGSSRAVHLFTVPSRLAAETGVREVGLTTLNADEELMAAKRGHKDSAKIATELAKAALVEADGNKLASADGSVDSFWKNLDPRLRQLVLTAYADLHGADEEDAESFLKSRKTRVA